jgi:uncharacterized protein
LSEGAAERPRGSNLLGLPWRSGREGDGELLLDVRLTPRAGHDRIDGTKTLADGRAVLLARVRAVPEKGAANAALIKLLAKTLNIGKSDIVVESGHTARTKVLRLYGDSKMIAERLGLITSAKK